MIVTITEERADSAAAAELIGELDALLSPHYPAESRHGYSVEKLLRESVTFFVVRHDSIPAACGGVQFFGAEYGELKRMYVRPQYRRRGLAKRLLVHLTEYSLQQGIGLLRLETGIYQQEAVALYEAFGFRRIGPFGNYRDDPLSLFYEKKLTPEYDTPHTDA